MYVIWEEYKFPTYCVLETRQGTTMASDHFDVIHDTSKEEIIKEELTEIKWSSENGVYEESLQVVGRDEKLHDLYSSNYEKNSGESKPSLTHFLKKPNFETENISAADDREVDKIENNIKVEDDYEDHPEFIVDFSSINAELEKQTLKSEDEIDIACEDIKLEMDGNELSGNKSHPNNIANIVPQESTIDFRAVPQRNTIVKEDETNVERDNGKQIQNTLVNTRINLFIESIQTAVNIIYVFKAGPFITLDHFVKKFKISFAIVIDKVGLYFIV
ncbi:hypothetical protein JTB14_037633 [Gonioctena quinquepunctata]|nr:hypothetical protein JTB14_037633 [Gonioctena quinquepunctata]